MSYQPIENYGIIGDLNTVALVSMEGSIDFLCFPNFDSPSVFAAILDCQKGGFFQIAPVLEGYRRKQLYLPDSNILLTRFLAQDGVAEVSDFMALGKGVTGRCIVRRVKAVRGDVRFQMTCAPRFDYGRATHRIYGRSESWTFVSDEATPLSLRLRSCVPMERREGDVVAEFHLQAGQTAFFVLELAESEHTDFLPATTNTTVYFNETLNYWRRWIGRCQYRGRWREMVHRSALALKLLTSARHGSTVAAATFGLPEDIGGERNWDYRFTWVRDSSLILRALMRLGYVEEAEGFFRWLERRISGITGEAPLRIMYALDGRHDLHEESLDHFEGYRGSRPVRIGNGAHDQLQLDIFGELMDALFLFDTFRRPVTYDAWTRVVLMLNWLEERWHLPDEGIWEVRGGRQEFLFSRVMCWVAFDRAIRLAKKRSFPAPVTKWKRIRQAIRDDVDRHFWNSELGCYVQHKGSSAVDASSLLFPMLGFVGPHETRWFFTMRRIEEKLVQDSLVFRYDTENAASDGLRGGEGTFTMCSFWYVECLARSGDLQKARFLFEKALGYANHLGLYAEELGPCGEHLGNFPQAFTHLALVNAAFELDQRLNKEAAASQP
ncbi:MAG: glycoside hydrolase family 15 protein [Limisphaerales bacterium]|jgi:GH15 family glucan-1,4-alpha-glucosidase